ncbi:transposable element Tcb1 transposase [Trichonephila clavipes]|uniref:Transposable element Tcb1 transposase n=1 Tax=Trichonephila clavipes TaxID=2585209 RepID=A0A8X6VRT0_TRICX|nr:transposable element Tcb1 transposase [Trichonephila clavipes]
MYGSTCADMPVDVMGQCLSSIKHVVSTTSGCFYPRSTHWEVGGRPQCDKCGSRVRNCSQHRFTTLTIRGFSSGRPRGTTPADDRYIVLQARRNRRQTAGEIARHTTQATGRPISRFTVARRLHGGGQLARRPVRCVPLTPAHRRRRSLWCREHRNGRHNEWGRVLFTNESRFSLSRDSHRILIWRERRSRNHPSNKGTGMEVAVFSFGEASCLVVVQNFTSSTQVQSTGPVIVTRFFFHMCVFLEALWVCSSFSWTTMHHRLTLLESEDIEQARKLIAPQLSQSYAQVTKLSTATTTTQTDENITKIVCPPLKLLQQLISVPKPTISSSVAAVNKSSTSTQAELVPSISSVTVTSPSKSQPTNSLIDTAPTASDNLSISTASSSSTA